MDGPDRYEGDPQMYVTGACDLDRRYIDFLRWLAEEGKLERDVADPGYASQ